LRGPFTVDVADTGTVDRSSPPEVGLGTAEASDRFPVRAKPDFGRSMAEAEMEGRKYFGSIPCRSELEKDEIFFKH
jgi:hypothetical protein